MIIKGSQQASSTDAKSAGSRQVRDAAGRFTGAKQSGKRRSRRSRSGVRGPSWLATKSKLDLARMLAKLSRHIDRLEAEQGTSNGDVRDHSKRLAGIRRGQEASVAARLAVLGQLVQECWERREKPSATALAARMAEKLSMERFAPQQLYRPPYDTVWRSAPDHLGQKKLVDGDPRVARNMRLTKPMLTYWILKLRATRDDLHLRSEHMLLEQSEDQDWSAW